MKSFRVTFTPEIKPETKPEEYIETVESVESASSGDIEDLGVQCPAKRYKKYKLSVTDLSAQLWCEKQLEFVLTTGRRRETVAMKEGIERHDQLEREDHDVIEVETSSREESLAFRLVSTINLLQLLLEKKKVREVWVFGIFDGVAMRGIIDELSIETRSGQEFLVISDTKTRKQETEPSDAQKRGTANQLQTYHWMVTNLQNDEADFGALFQIFRVDSELLFTSEYLKEYENLDHVARELRKIAGLLPPVAEEVFVSYECKGVEFARCPIPASSHLILYTLRDMLSWWMGQREADGVLKAEDWKCKSCDFVESCSKTPLPADVVKRIADLQALKDFDEELSQEPFCGQSQTTPSIESLVPIQKETGCRTEPIITRKRDQGRFLSGLRKRGPVPEQVSIEGFISKRPRPHLPSQRKVLPLPLEGV